MAGHQKRNNQGRGQAGGGRSSTEMIEVSRDDSNTSNDNNTPTSDENGETSEEEEVGPAQRSQRAGRGKAARWLGDEN